MFFSTGIDTQYTENLARPAGGPSDRPRLIFDLERREPGFWRHPSPRVDHL